MQPDLMLRRPTADEEEDALRAHGAISPDVSSFLHCYKGALMLVPSSAAESMCGLLGGHDRTVSCRGDSVKHTHGAEPRQRAVRRLAGARVGAQALAA